MKRYFFLAYLWRTAERESWVPSSNVVDEHPLAFVARAWATHGKNVAGFEIQLTFFHELTEEEFYRYR